MKRLAIRPGRYTGEIRMTKEEKEEILKKNKSINFPPDLLKKLDEAESKKNEEKKKEDIRKDKKAKEEEKKSREIEKRIKSKKHIKLVNSILDWCQLFSESEQGKRILGVSKKVSLLCAKFFKGEPVSGLDVSRTRVELIAVYGQNPLVVEEIRFTCTEWYKASSREILNISIKYRYKENLMLRVLHPKLIEELAEVIKTEKVYEYIKDSIPTPRV